MAASAPIPVDDQGRVDVDLPCLECGYNLRTQSLETGRCPECSLPVGRSAVGNRLHFCDPDWLTRVGHGLTALGLAGIAVGGITAVTWSQVDGSLKIGVNGLRWRSQYLESFVAGQGYPSVVVLIATALICVYAAWRSTSPDPMTRKDEWIVSSRKVARWFLVAFVAQFFLFVAMWTRSVYASGDEGATWKQLAGTALALWPITGGLGAAGLLVYAGSLADRSDAPGLGRLLRTLTVLGLALGGVAVLHATNWFGVGGYLAHWLSRPFAVFAYGTNQGASQGSIIWAYANGGGQFITQPWYSGPFGLRYYAGPIDLGPISYSSGDALLRAVTAWSAPALLAVLVGGALLLLWLWTRVRKHVALARQSWASRISVGVVRYPVDSLPSKPTT